MQVMHETGRVQVHRTGPCSGELANVSAAGGQTRELCVCGELSQPEIDGLHAM